MSSVADPTVANTVMGWHAEKDLDDMCRDAWNWTKQFI
jgi:UDP-glucose 4-epimerase